MSYLEMLDDGEEHTPEDRRGSEEGSFVPQARQALEATGAFVAHSRVYGDLLILRDDEVPIHSKYESLPRWTLEEIERLLEDDPPPDVISHFMELKRTLPEATYHGQEADNP